MSVRLATRADTARLEGFLLEHADGSMYPLGNLRRHGVVPTDHIRSMDFWIAENDGQITGTIGVTREGFIFPQVPRPDVALSDLVRRSVARKQLQGIIGTSRQAHDVLKDFGLDGVPILRLGDEPQYGLDTSELSMPDTRGFQLVGLGRDRLDLITAWRGQFLQEVIGLAEKNAEAKAAVDVEGFLAMDTHRLLLRAGVPVSFTGFNSALPEIVQVGAVFTPPDLRRQSFARAAVAMHLAEAREDGVKRAVLSAASASAARAYEAIGFRRIGDFSMIFFDGPQKVRP